MAQRTADAASTREAAREQRSSRRAVTVFPLLILAGAAVGLLFPQAFEGWSAGVTPALMIIMFGMGLTLSLPDFALVLKRPTPVIAGVVLQFTVMPLLALGIATVLDLPPQLAAGMILVGSVPGGTSSNVVTYLAKGDVALSVTMTSLSTLLSPLLTPLITLALAGQFLEVPTGDLALSLVQIVLVPVIAGLILHSLAPGVVRRIEPVLPWVSVLGITYVVIAVVSGSGEVLAAAGLGLIAGVILHNLLGYALGYGIAALVRFPAASRRAVSVEVGMQNSGLASGLATQYFTPEAALPGAIFSVWHNISGGILASIWGRRPTDRADSRAR
ncbi:bile acid:sodium symporter family protein [Kocuria palustris]|uniref:bile acid:sodium symporter family protein n=1 Tax=Kocuria palustris TaxID=71999 RepID=UPI0011A457D7|nr:bile acid:sodium symporter family protein [Kocuria palustris]